MAGAAIYRSAEHTPPPAEIVLNQGLVYVYENDLSLAIETFQELLQRELTGDQESRTRLNLRSEEHTSELQSRGHLVCRLLLEKKKSNMNGSEGLQDLQEQRSTHIYRQKT